MKKIIRIILVMTIGLWSTISLSNEILVERNLQEVSLYAGQAYIAKLESKITRIAVGDPGVADYKSIGEDQIYILGHKTGSTNLILWYASGETQVININVEHDIKVLKEIIKRELPNEHGLIIKSTAGTITLSGNVSDTLKANTAVKLTNAYIKNVLLAENSELINLLKVKDPQQVLLEVIIASVDKSLLTQVGSKIGTKHSGSTSYSIVSSAAGAGAPLVAGGSPIFDPSSLFLNLLISNGNLDIGLSADEINSMIRVLAKPNIVTLSGQEGKFLKGGRTFIPIDQGDGSITLQEEEFGVGVTFLPTVMDGGRVHLKVAPEVSSLSQSTLSSSVGDSESIMPIFNTKSVSTTVQLNNGDTLMIGGLLDEETINTINGVPGLKNVPLFGALFRDGSTNKIQTELVVLIKVSIVQATPEELIIPTDKVHAPTKEEFLLGGEIEGKGDDVEQTEEVIKPQTFKPFGGNR